MENRYQRLQELCDLLRDSQTAIHPTPTINPLRGANPMGRHNSLSGGVSRQTTHMGLLGPVLNKRSELPIRNGVLLYKQLIRPLTDYACPVWRSAARTRFRRLQMIQSKCLRLVTGALRYLSNRQIHEDLSVPLFADHVRALTARFDSR
jgi:hypothetical protein